MFTKKTCRAVYRYAAVSVGPMNSSQLFCEQYKNYGKSPLSYLHATSAKQQKQVYFICYVTSTTCITDSNSLGYCSTCKKKNKNLDNKTSLLLLFTKSQTCLCPKSKIFRGGGQSESLQASAEFSCCIIDIRVASCCWFLVFPSFKSKTGHFGVILW